MDAGSVAAEGTPGRSQEIRALLREYGVFLDETVDDDAALISSGRLDSLALFQLILWVEGNIGHPVDLRSVNLASEWDSIGRILHYVDQSLPGAIPSRRAAPARHAVLRNQGTLDIVRYTAADKHAVAHLQTGLWSKDPERNLQYLEWKYENNPFLVEPHIYLALERGEVVGMRGFHGARWEVGQPCRQHDVLVADDLLVREDHRNSGLVHQIMQVALADLSARGEDFVFNLGGGAITVLGSLAMGWKSAGALNPIRRRAWSSELRSRIRHGVTFLPLLWRFENSPALYSPIDRNAFLNLDGLAGPITSGDGLRITVSRKPRPDSMADLVRRLEKDGRIRHVRDAVYYAWRFQNPLHEYRFFYAGDDALDGYLVVRRHRGLDAPDPRVRLVDLEVVDESTRRALLEAVARPGLFADLEAWSATLDPLDDRCLQRAGLKSVVQSQALQGHPCILVRPADDARLEEPWHLDGVPLLDLRNWDLRMLYSMAG